MNGYIKINELMFIIGILLWAAIASMVMSLMKDGYYAIIRFKNRRIRKHIDILYCMGLIESAKILQDPLLNHFNHWRSKL